MDGFGGTTSADERLAAEIADALAKEGLVPPSQVARVREKLAIGTASEADWLAWLASGSSRAWEKDDGRSH